MLLDLFTVTFLDACYVKLGPAGPQKLGEI